MKFSSFVSRRSFIQKILLFFAAAMAGTSCDFESYVTTEEVTKEAVKLLYLPYLATIIGRQYLKQDIEVSRLTSEQLISRILHGTTINPSKASRSSLMDIDDEIYKKIRNDFVLERIEKMNGWLFSKTEIQLCALLVITS